MQNTVFIFISCPLAIEMLAAQQTQTQYKLTSDLTLVNRHKTVICAVHKS